MSGFVSKTITIKRARSAHRCEWCGQEIERHATYRSYSEFGRTTVYTIRMHPECLEAMHEAAHDEGGWIEFIPFDQERPETR